MKILFCHDHIFKEYEGEYYSPGKISIEQMESYQSLGDNITIVARSNKVTSLDSSKHNQITHNRVSFCAFPNASNFKSLILRKELLKKAIKIASQYDIIIARLPSEIGSIFAQAGRKLNKPVLIEVVACVWDNLYYFGTIKAKLYAPLAYVRMRNLVKQADFVHYVTSSFLQKRYPTKKGALTLSASDVILSTVSNSQRNLKKNNEISIGVVGSMDNKIKGISLAIKAVKILSNSTNEKITLHIIGPGDKKKYQNLASRLNLLENINFVGSLSDSKAVQKY
ncbi:glycosyltransferase, partial [Escherichia coli]|nr:glycosyltransferase [Escherichia coli]